MYLISRSKGTDSTDVLSQKAEELALYIPDCLHICNFNSRPMYTVVYFVLAFYSGKMTFSSEVDYHACVTVPLFNR